MLDHLRQRVTQALSAVGTVTLACCGPADVQSGTFPCQTLGLRLYVLVPGTSDHLLNIGHSPSVLATAPEWQLRGAARILEPGAADYPATLELLSAPAAAWSELVEIRPVRIHLAAAAPHARETIDVVE